jgi:hypothetical protein
MSVLYASIGRKRRQYDPDARLYLGLVESATGTATTGTQRKAISDFIEAEKTASRWDLLKRIYLPIWGNAAANAICLKSRASGTFVGTVTHGAGFVQGDGSTGYFDMGVTPNGAGLSHGDEFYFGSQLTDSGQFTSAVLGASTSLAGFIRLDFSTVNTFRSRSRANNISITPGSVQRIRSILAINSAALNDRKAYILRNGSILASASNTTTETLTTLPSDNIFTMARNGSGSAADFHSGQIPFYGMSRSLSSDAEIEAFSLNLQNCWQSLTGQTL